MQYTIHKVKIDKNARVIPVLTRWATIFDFRKPKHYNLLHLCQQDLLGRGKLDRDDNDTVALIYRFAHGRYGLSFPCMF